MKRIGMIVAVEMNAVLSRYGTPEGEITENGFRVLTYRNESYTLYVLNCGVGEIAAAAGTQFLICRFHVDMILNFGIVGGLTQEMSHTRVCLVGRVVHYDIDTSAVDGIEPGRYLDYPDVYIPADETLLEKALAFSPGLKVATCASGDKFIADPEKKAELVRLYGADICEMEAAGIFLTCRRSGVPFLSVKAVADCVDDGDDGYWDKKQSSSELCLSVADRLIRSL